MFHCLPFEYKTCVFADVLVSHPTEDTCILLIGSFFGGVFFFNVKDLCILLISCFNAEDWLMYTGETCFDAEDLYVFY